MFCGTEKKSRETNEQMKQGKNGGRKVVLGGIVYINGFNRGGSNVSEGKREAKGVSGEHMSLWVIVCYDGMTRFQGWYSSILQ